MTVIRLENLLKRCDFSWILELEFVAFLRLETMSLVHFKWVSCFWICLCKGYLVVGALLTKAVPADYMRFY